MIEYIIVHVGYEQVYGTKLQLDEAVSRLRRYPFQALMSVLAFIDAAISLTSLDTFAKGHRLVMRRLLTSKQRSDFARFVENYKKQERRRAQLVVFHELQLLNAVKLALLHCDEETQENPNDLGPLTEALLILNDHLIPSESWPEDYDSLSEPQKREYFVHYTVRNMVFHRGTRILNFLSRWHDLFFLDAPSLSSRKDYVDLPGSLTSLTGLDARLFYWIGMAFFTHWLILDAEKFDPDKSALNPQMWFKDFDIRPEEYEPVLRQFASTREGLVAQFEGRTEWEPYFLLPIQARPLLRFGDLIICLSRRFTAEKISSGLYHLLLTMLPTKQQRDGFLTFFGFVFESYVNRLLKRVFPASPLVQRCFTNVIDPKTGNEIADAILDYGDALIVIEVKASLFSLPVLVTGDPRALEQKFQDIVYDSAEQLQRAIDSIKGGALSHHGLTNSRIKGFFPLVVSLEYLPWEPFTYRKLLEEITARGFLQGRDIAPMQVAYVEDLENLETAMGSGKALIQLLREKLADERLREMSFRNFLYERVPEIEKQHNAYLYQRFQMIMNEVLDFIRSRQKYIAPLEE